jgi:RHS repeat-associated protein
MAFASDTKCRDMENSTGLSGVSCRSARFFSKNRRGTFKLIHPNPSQQPPQPPRWPPGGILGATIDPNGTGGYRVEADLNRDGKISLTDRTMVGSPRAAIPAGWISDRTGADNPVGYAGYFFSHETDQYCQRFRWYDPRRGRWMQRDPAGDVDGLNLYEYVRSSPLRYRDPLGLQSIHPTMYSGDDSSPFGDFSCRIAVACTPVFKWGVQVPGRANQHCGLLITTSAGATYSLDGSGGDINQLLLVSGPMGRAPSGPTLRITGDECLCLLTQNSRWNTAPPPRDHENNNSNWTLKCQLKACGTNMPGLFAGVTVPTGFNSQQELQFTRPLMGDCPPKMCRECPGDPWTPCP